MTRAEFVAALAAAGLLSVVPGASRMIDAKADEEIGTITYLNGVTRWHDLMIFRFREKFYDQIADMVVWDRANERREEGYVTIIFKSRHNFLGGAFDAVE